MSDTNPIFVSWEEDIICHERGRRVVHYYLKESSGNSLLAVVGFERSVRHMMYVVSGEFAKAYGSKSFIQSGMKWRARWEVVEWLQTLISRERMPLELHMDESMEGLKSLEESGFESNGCETYSPNQMVARKLKVKYSDIVWSGSAWSCAKQLKHYQAFYRNGSLITVHSFVFVMAEEETQYLGYLEDMYEDKKGQKKAKVRWFHHSEEVKLFFPQLNSESREVFITPHVQVIRADSIDGLATVLTPKHYDKLMMGVHSTLPSGVYVCSRQFKNHKVKPFTITKLRGYSNQSIISSFDGSLVSKQSVKYPSFNGDGNRRWNPNDPITVSSKRFRNSDSEDKPGSAFGVKNLENGNEISAPQAKYPKIRLRFSRKMTAAPQFRSPLCFKVGDKIEFLCHDSGIRGCWFRCRVLKASKKHLKIQYDDLMNVDESENLEEWVTSYREAAPDKLGMRSPGRLTIRPCPPKDCVACDCKVGSAVDVWWSNGWWEGVVTEIGVSCDGDLKVYLPGEDTCLTVHRENVRTSRDWIYSKWVEIERRPDILSYLSKNGRSACPSNSKAAGCNGILPAELNVITRSKHEDQAPLDDEQESPAFVTAASKTTLEGPHEESEGTGKCVMENNAEETAILFQDGEPEYVMGEIHESATATKDCTGIEAH